MISYKLLIIAFCIYILYNLSVLLLFGIPRSLSMTYYLFKGTKVPATRHLFTFIMFLIAVCLAPIWLESTPDTNQYSVFIALCGILFVGAAPEFMKSNDEDMFHTISAYISVIFATIWVICIMHLWWIIIIWNIIFIVLMYCTGTYKTSITYWLENAAFMSVFTSIFILN